MQDKIDDPHLNENLLFYQGKIPSVPNGKSCVLDDFPCFIFENIGGE